MKIFIPTQGFTFTFAQTRACCTQQVVEQQQLLLDGSRLEDCDKVAFFTKVPRPSLSSQSSYPWPVSACLSEVLHSRSRRTRRKDKEASMLGSTFAALTFFAAACTVVETVKKCQ